MWLASLDAALPCHVALGVTAAADLFFGCFFCSGPRRSSSRGREASRQLVTACTVFSLQPLELAASKAVHTVSGCTSTQSPPRPLEGAAASTFPLVALAFLYDLFVLGMRCGVPTKSVWRRTPGLLAHCCIEYSCTLMYRAWMALACVCIEAHGTCN